MAEAEKNPERSCTVLVFGLERQGLPVPPKPLKSRNFTVIFEKYGTSRRFQEFDGVVMFQGIFEKFEMQHGYMDSHLSHTYDADELDKRKKEVALLLGQGGFICFLLTKPFLDSEGGRDFAATDLAKYELNYASFYRKNFSSRAAHVTPVADELKRFLDMFGAASSYFENFNKSLDCRVLAKVSNVSVGLVIDQTEYFVPSLLPDSRSEAVVEYFELLVDAISSIHNKLHQSIPDWVDGYEFEEEPTLRAQRSELVTAIAEIDTRLTQLAHYKAALVHSGPPLVADVCTILESTFGVKTDATDEFREDVKLVDDENKIVGLCEIKGINRGVSRENINQTDSHRERAGFDTTFPALLIANTNIKSARTISEKDQEIAGEQVKHAVHMRVLVLRTLDLLGLLRLVLAGKLSKSDARSLVLERVGWLRVQGTDVVVLTGE